MYPVWLDSRPFQHVNPFKLSFHRLLSRTYMIAAHLPVRAPSLVYSWIHSIPGLSQLVERLHRFQNRLAATRS